MANASWGSIDFDVLESHPFNTPVPAQRHALSVRHVPWGNRTIVQDLGREPVETTYPAELSTSEYLAALPLIGTAATLTVTGDGSHSGAVLLDIDEIRRDDTNSIVTVNLKFLVL